MTSILITPEPEKFSNHQPNELVHTIIWNAVETYQGARTYGALAIHIDTELQKEGIILPELQLKSLAIQALRRTSG